MAAYPGLLPPPVPYPRRSRRRLAAGLVLVCAVAAVAGWLGYRAGGEHNPTAQGSGGIAEAGARSAIQDYLNALMDRDIDTIARNTLCGLYDEVTDRRPDNAVAKMNSDAFRKQFAQAEVASVDKIVYLSDVQAQALFTVRVNRVGSEQRRKDTQGVAQLLAVDGHVLVCSYLLRGVGTY